MISHRYSQFLWLLGFAWEILGNPGKSWNSPLFWWNYQMAVISGLLGKSWEILGNLGKSWNSSLFRWNYQMAVISDLLGKSWEILGNLEILLYFNGIIKWLLFSICLGNLGKSWEILWNLGKSWEILKFFFISMKLSNGCYFRFAWEIFSKNY